MADIVKKTIQTRIAQKHDVEENWNKAENFIPKKGEIIIYDKDDNHVTIRVKVGDGVTVVKSLPFITDNYYTITEINSKLDGKQDKLEPGVNLLGTDGITIDKAADSENIEVSGKNLIKDPYPGVNNTGANIVNYKPYGSADWGSAFVRNTHSLVNNAEAGAIVGYDNGGVIYAKTTSDDPWSVVNKEYAEENFRKVVTGSASEIKVYTTKYGDTQSWMFLNSDPDGAPGAEIPQYGTGGTLRANMPEIVLDNSVVNRKYADDNYVKKISKQTIVEQVSSGNSYELSKISSLEFTINDSSFTSVNDVCQICFATESQFDITIPDGTYLCVGDGFSIDKKTISCITNKVYYITIGYTPFGIEIVSSIDEIASNNLAA